ncbi:MAG: hypothetical protein ACI4IE_09250 [Eubacterium sp.]
MKNTYKELFDGIKPDEKLVDSVFEMRHRKKNKRLVPKIISAVLAVAVIAGGTGFTVQYDKNKKITEHPIGSVMIASASDSIGKSTINIAYNIHVKNIEGMTEEEIYDAKIEMLKDLNYGIDDEDTLKDGLKNAVKINGNALYATDRGFNAKDEIIEPADCSFSLQNIENPENVETIYVSNNSKYANAIISCEDLYYTEPKENVFVFDNRCVDTDKTFMVGHNLSVEGSRYAQCRRIENPKNKFYSYEQYYLLDKDDDFYMRELSVQTGLGTAFYISYEFSDAFFDALGENPDMDLTAYKDNLTVRVDFKDGNTATTVLELGINAKGYLTAKCVSYDYSKAK